jgi:RsiW-degrading membrane proteinase PrsW (M82 family)
MTILLYILSASLPVIIYLVTLVIIDSYKLVKYTSIVAAILYGCAAAFISLLLNNLILDFLKIDFIYYAKYLAPIIEESLKAAFIIVLIWRRKTGFLVDAAINGFAIGTGFALVENLYYLQTLSGGYLLVWIIRGFGTAIMHGGTTAIFALLSINYSSRHPQKKLIIFIPGLLAAILIHSFFNHFILSPLLMTIGQLVILPLLTIWVYTRSETALQEWLEAGMDVDVWLLDYINTGRVYQTKVGEYLNSLKARFPGEAVGDMLCYVRLHLELALRAKGILMLQEQGFPIPDDPEIREKLQELKYLEKSIGKTGRLALTPILHTGIQERWQLRMIGKK